MPKKFDTNPLDPEFPEKAKAAAENGPDVEAYRSPAGSYPAPPSSPYSTAEFPVRPTAPPSVTEDETQRFSEAQYNAYAFQGGQVPATYEPSRFADMNRAGERKESKTGIPEKWLIGLPYLPYAGLFAGLILLLIIPKEENKVRFHAAQGLAANVAVWIISTVLGMMGNVITPADWADGIFGVVSTVLLIIFAVKAWSGKPVHIQAVDDLTNWLEEKIGPIKS